MQMPHQVCKTVAYRRGHAGAGACEEVELPIDMPWFEQPAIHMVLALQRFKRMHVLHWMEAGGEGAHGQVLGLQSRPEVQQFELHSVPMTYWSLHVTAVHRKHPAQQFHIPAALVPRTQRDVAKGEGHDIIRGEPDRQDEWLVLLGTRNGHSCHVDLLAKECARIKVDEVQPL